MRGEGAEGGGFRGCREGHVKFSGGLRVQGGCRRMLRVPLTPARANPFPGASCGCAAIAPRECPPGLGGLV